MLNRVQLKAHWKDSVKKMKNKHVNIPVFVPHKGCPNDCSFCNQRKITGQITPVTKETVRSVIDDHLKTIDHEKTEIKVAFFGGSFTGIPKEEQKELLELANKYLKNGLIDGIRLSTRPDYINDDILSFLKSYGVTAIELGAQSMIDKVLKLNDRGHLSSDTEKAALKIKSYGFELGLQMMTGLYGDDKDGAIYSAKKIIALNPECVRIYPTLTIFGTKLHKLYEEGKYIPMSLDETVELCGELLDMFEEAQIKVLRVGLLGTDNINDENDVIAGPFHQSIGELAESEKFYNKLVRDIEKIDLKDLKVSVNPRYISIAVGNKKKNVKRLFEKFPQKNIKIMQNENINYGEFVIE